MKNALFGLCGSVALAALSPASRALPNDVFVLDEQPGPGVDFTTFADAIPQLGAGDILIVRSGNYIAPFQLEPFAVPAESLTIVGEGYPLIPDLRFTGLNSNQSAVLRGVRLGNGAVEGSSNQGTLWIEDSGFSPDPNLAITLARGDFESCDSVVLERCRMRGQQAFVTPGTPGVRASGSSLFAHGSILRGGPGFVSVGFQLAAGTGLSLSESDAFLSGSELLAGQGGLQFPVSDAVQTGLSESLLIETSGDWNLLGGTQVTLPEQARSFEASALTREGESVTFSFGAPEGELAVLNISLNPLTGFLPSFASAGLIATPLLLLEVLDPMPSSEQLEFQLPVPFFAPGFEGLTLYSQGSYLNLAEGTVRLGGGSAFTVLDESF